MYIEFRLPSGAGGMAAGYTKMAIVKQLNQVCEQYKIKLARQHTLSYRFRIEFNDQRDLTLFALIWQPKNTYFKYTVWHEPIDTPSDPKRYYAQ